LRRPVETARAERTLRIRPADFRFDPERTFEPVTDLDCIATHLVRRPGSNGFDLDSKPHT